MRNKFLFLVIIRLAFYFLEETNIALKRPAYSSSKYSTLPTKAVDGNTENIWNNGLSCWHTGVSDYNSWWMVILDRLSYVRMVVIHNRLGCCCKIFIIFSFKDILSVPSLAFFNNMYNSVAVLPKYSLNINTTLMHHKSYMPNKLCIMKIYKSLLFCSVYIH